MKKLLLFILLLGVVVVKAQNNQPQYVWAASQVASDVNKPNFTGFSPDSMRNRFTAGEFVKLLSRQAPETTPVRYAFDSNLPISAAALKFGITDYAILPGHGAGFELHDNEVRTTNGAVITLSTTYLSAEYFTARPADKMNGAAIANKGVYKELYLGSGKTPWLIENAPEKNQEASVELITSGNQFRQNVNGAFIIKIPDGNSMEMASTTEGGVIGWKVADEQTRLTLSAGLTNVTGELNVESWAKAHTGLMVGDLNFVNAKLLASSLTFGQNDLQGSLAFQKDPNTDITGTFVMQTTGSGGIYLNAAYSNPGMFGGIRFAVNDQTNIQIYQNSIVFGGGLPEGSAYVTIHSIKGGVAIPVMFDSQIKQIINPTEGTIAYSRDHKTLVVYNGTDWEYSTCREKIQ